MTACGTEEGWGEGEPAERREMGGEGTIGFGRHVGSYSGKTGENIRIEHTTVGYISESVSRLK